MYSRAKNRLVLSICGDKRVWKVSLSDLSCFQSLLCCQHYQQTVLVLISQSWAWCVCMWACHQMFAHAHFQPAIYFYRNSEIIFLQWVQADSFRHSYILGLNVTNAEKQHYEVKSLHRRDKATVFHTGKQKVLTLMLRLSSCPLTLHRPGTDSTF